MINVVVFSQASAWSSVLKPNDTARWTNVKM